MTPIIAQHIIILNISVDSMYLLYTICIFLYMFFTVFFCK